MPDRLDSHPAPTPSADRRSETEPLGDPGLRRLAHELLDQAFDHLEGVRQRPVWQRPNEAARALFRAPLPQQGFGPAAALGEVLEHVLPYSTGNLHPRFFGWAMGAGSPLGVVAEMLAATMNANVGAFDQAATHLEAQVMRWLAEALGFAAPEEWSDVEDEGRGPGGLLLSGASTANLAGLAVARDAQPTEGSGRPVIYASSEVHLSVPKALRILGLPPEALRLLPVDRDFRLRPSPLAATVRDDLDRGRRPSIVVAQAGTVNTGATDDLEGIATVCREHGLWLHVDGAFGALAALSPRLRGALEGLQLADSLAFDAHKWLPVPYGAGALLVRRREDLQRAFAISAPYLAGPRGGPAEGGPAFGGLGPELSRPFRALKVWLALRSEGVEGLARRIEGSVERARELAARVEEHPSLQLGAPVPLNVVCFRYRPAGLSQPALKRLNQELLVRLQEEGVVLPSGTVLHGRFYLRAGFFHPDTQSQDVETLVAETLRLGEDLHRRMGGAGDGPEAATPA